ncbi:MAG: MBOAT family protein [Ruminococcus sp.]|nr:MBOAT family protein [Ruminococcus sp.]
MIFSSLLFIYAFLPVSLIIYLITPEKLRKYTLLALSVVFCAMSGLGFLVFMSLYTLLNYILGRIIRVLRKRKAVSAAFTALAIAFDIFVLIYFREDILSGFIGKPELLSLIEPVGISFSALTVAGYLIDIARGSLRAEHSLADFALYMMFFPKLPMGPVIGYSAFRRMLDHRSETKLSEIGSGLALFIKGLAKKIILADNIYLLYSAVKSIQVQELSSLSAVLGIISHGFCLYFTLSGLSDMGAGLSQCFGIHMPQSFRYPIQSNGIRDFCSRWHISVVNWFRKHILRPVSWKTDNRFVQYLVFIIIWGFIGLWYDISVNMLIWGLLTGIIAVCEKLFPIHKMIKPTARIYTMLVLGICSVFFFGESLSYSLRYFTAIIGANSGLADKVSLYLLKEYILIILACVIASSSLYKELSERFSYKWLRRIRAFAAPVILTGLLAICTIEMSYTGVSEMMLPVLQGVAK